MATCSPEMNADASDYKPRKEVLGGKRKARQRFFTKHSLVGFKRMLLPECAYLVQLGLGCRMRTNAKHQNINKASIEKYPQRARPFDKAWADESGLCFIEWDEGGKEKSRKYKTKYNVPFIKALNEMLSLIRNEATGLKKKDSELRKVAKKIL